MDGIRYQERTIEILTKHMMLGSYKLVSFPEQRKSLPKSLGVVQTATSQQKMPSLSKNCLCPRGWQQHRKVYHRHMWPAFRNYPHWYSRRANLHRKRPPCPVYQDMKISANICFVVSTCFDLIKNRIHNTWATAWVQV